MKINTTFSNGRSADVDRNNHHPQSESCLSKRLKKSPPPLKGVMVCSLELLLVCLALSLVLSPTLLQARVYLEASYRIARSSDDKSNWQSARIEVKNGIISVYDWDSSRLVSRFDPKKMQGIRQQSREIKSDGNWLGGTLFLSGALVYFLYSVDKAQKIQEERVDARNDCLESYNYDYDYCVSQYPDHSTSFLDAGITAGSALVGYNLMLGKKETEYYIPLSNSIEGRNSIEIRFHKDKDSEFFLYDVYGDARKKKDRRFSFRIHPKRNRIFAVARMKF